MNDFTKLMIDAATGSVQKYSVADANEAIRQKFYEVLEVEPNTQGVKLRKAIRKHKNEIFELIEETIDNRLFVGWGENPFFQNFVDSRNLALGDRNEFYTPDSCILTVSKYSGGHHNIMRQKLGMGEVFSVHTDWYGIKVYEEFERFMAQRIDWAKFIEKLYEAVDKKVGDMLYASFIGIDKSVPAAFKSTGTLTGEAVLAMAEKVAVASGHDVMIASTRAGLRKLDALGGVDKFSDDMKNERNTSGVLRYFEGIQTMVIPQSFKPGTREFAMPDKLYIFPLTDDKPIKFVTEGESIFNENTDSATNADMTIQGEYLTKFGVATIFGTDYSVLDFA